MDIRILTGKEVMDILNISQPTFYQWVKKRKLKGYKVGRKWLFKENEIMALIDKGANVPDNTEYDRRKSVVDKILSESVKIEGMTAADLVRAGREERHAENN